MLVWLLSRYISTFAKSISTNDSAINQYVTIPKKSTMKSSVFTAVSTFFVLVVLASCNQNTEITDKQSQVDDKHPTKCSSCPKYNQRMDSVLFVREVMHFVADKADVGNVKHALCDTFYRIEFSQLPVDSYLKLFEADEGTATCGLAATIMAKILVENGFDAYTYNFGFENTPMTHVVVLVKNEGRLLVFDPFMNYELVDENGRHVRLENLFESISMKHEPPTFKSDTIIADFLMDISKLTIDQQSKLKSHEFSKYDSLGTWLSDSIYRTKYPRCYECSTIFGENHFILAFEDTLRSRMGLTYFYQAFPLKINRINGAKDCLIIDAYVDSLISSASATL